MLLKNRPVPYRPGDFLVELNNMSFLIQGKNNWKSLLIVIFLTAFIVYSLFLFWQYLSLSKKTTALPKEITKEVTINNLNHSLLPLLRSFFFLFGTFIVVGMGIYKISHRLAKATSWEERALKDPEYIIADHERQAAYWRDEMEKNALKKNINNEIKIIKDMEFKYFRLKNNSKFSPKEKARLASDWEVFIYCMLGLYRGQEEENRTTKEQIEKRFNDLLAENK